MRYSSVRCPPEDFQIPIPPTLVPGATIRRLFGNGPLLLLTNSYAESAGPGTNAAGLLVYLDADEVAYIGDRQNVPAGSQIFLGFSVLIEPIPGLHTLEIYTNGPDIADFIMPANALLFAVIELPAWDTTILTPLVPL